MSSKFQTSRLQFKTPPVCKKSPPGPPEPTFPPDVLEGFFWAQGSTTSGFPVNTLHTIVLPRVAGVDFSYQTTFANNGISWTLRVLRTQATPPTWLNWFGIAADTSVIAHDLAAFDQLRTDPYDSGYQILAVTVGTGASATRILL